MAITPGTILNSAQSIVAITAKDVVAIYDKDFKQLFSNFIFGERVLNPFLSGARPRKAEVNLSSKLMSHPLENGATIVDHRVRNLIEIRIPMLVNQPTLVDMLISNGTVFKEIKHYYDTSALLIVQTKSGVYKNMVIEEMPEIEDAEYFNTLQIELRLKEAPFVTPKTTVSSANPKNTNTSRRGLVQKAGQGSLTAGKTSGVLPQGLPSYPGQALPLSESQIAKLKSIFGNVNPAGR